MELFVCCWQIPLQNNLWICFKVVRREEQKNNLISSLPDNFPSITKTHEKKKCLKALVSDSHCRGRYHLCILAQLSTSEPRSIWLINLWYYPKWIICNKSFFLSGTLVCSVEWLLCLNMFSKSIDKQSWCGWRSL